MLNLSIQISLTLNLIVQATLALIYEILFNSLVPTCMISQLTLVANNKHINHCLLMKNKEITSIANFITSNCWSLPQGVSTIVHTGLKVFKKSSKDLQFVIKNLLVSYKWSQTKSISCTNFYQSVSPIAVKSNMNCWWIDIKESLQYKLYKNIGDLTKAIFWYQSNDTKRKPSVILCSLDQINKSSGSLHIIAYIAVIL